MHIFAQFNLNRSHQKEKSAKQFKKEMNGPKNLLTYKIYVFGMSIFVNINFFYSKNELLAAKSHISLGYSASV